MRGGANQSFPPWSIISVLCCLAAWLCMMGCEAATDQYCDQAFSSSGQIEISKDCRWRTAVAGGTKLPAAVVLKGLRSAGVFPALTLSQDGPLHGAVDDGFHLTLKRLVLRNATLTPPYQGSATPHVPRLLPLGLFDAVPRNLTLLDVRLVVQESEFQQYLEFFAKQLRAGGPDAVAGPSMHTDNTSFLNVPYYSDNTTEVFSLTLITGPCRQTTSSSTSSSASLSSSLASSPGCNVRTVDNSTLVPTLLRDASIATQQPLLIRVISNVSLSGSGLQQHIMIRRPVLLLGMASAATSIDFDMTVNQLNVTATGQLLWQSLVLENLAPGDAVSSLAAAPFSATVTTNVWAVFCKRSRSPPCLTLSNVTLVVPSQDELNYQIFMYTLFNSPAPALRELTEFYRTDLDTKTIQFLPGPGNDTLTTMRLLNRGWNFWYVVSTLKPIVAPKRPLPRQAFDMQKYRTGALVQALQDCSGFVSALSSRSSSTRTRVWTLVNNISITDSGHLQCSWPDGNITYPMQLLGQVVHTFNMSSHVHGVPDRRSTEGIVLGQAMANEGASTHAQQDGFDVYGAPLSPPLSELYSLSFGYMPDLFQLPADAQDKFLQIQNITLAQLPQAARSQAAVRGVGRRLLQQQQQRMPPGQDSSPVGIWTILLWPIKRAMLGVPVTIADSQLLIPQPEWDALADEARQAPSFALQLQGQSGGLTFTGVSLYDGRTLRVGSFQGPGITGTNLWLLSDPAAAANMPGYTWPSELFGSADSNSNSISTRHSKAVGLQAGVGVAVGVLGVVLAVALAVLVARLRKRRQQHATAAAGGKDLGGDPAGLCKGCAAGPEPATHNKQQHLAQGSNAGDADVISVHDTIGQLPQAQELAGAIAAANAKAPQAPGSKDPSSSRRSSRRSSYSLTAVSTNPSGSGSDCEQPGGGGGGGTAAEGPVLCSSKTASSSQGPSVEQTIADGLERWNAAVSMTTLQLMQRRLQSNNSLYSHAPSSGTSGSTGVTSMASQQQQLLRQQQQQMSPAAAATASSSTAASAAAGGSSRAADVDQGLQLHELIGSGSFGAVFAGTWRGKRVAVKVMHLHGNALMASEELPGSNPEQQQQQLRLQRQKQQNSPPHMAIMEAVVSSAMSHPNVVQVYTYMLSPLMVQPGAQAGHAAAVAPVLQQRQQPQQQQHGAEERDGSSGSGGVFGWQLRLVLEMCDKGTLRDALDRRQLPKFPGTTFPHPAVVYSLSHDVAAAMLHLHSEGIVHGDLKTANVLLTANAAPSSSSTSRDGCGGSAAEVWAAAGGDRPLTAKVADFGLALPLGPSDTHATQGARGTPTHMSPELFMAGHVSKASDVYAYGIMLYELITGSRAFARVPIPLLPHEVAIQGLRPQWPEGMPPGCRDLRKLAEACWAHKPQDRPMFDKILPMLEGTCGIPDPPPQQQQRQQPSSHGRQQQQQLQDGCGPAVHPQPLRPVVGVQHNNNNNNNNKGPRDQMSWSEISYGGSRHDGGWA